jgi:hypothetical protein
MYPALIFRWGIYILFAVALLRMAWAAQTPWKFWAIPFIAFYCILDPLADHLPVAVFAWSLLVSLDHSRWRTAGLFVLAFLAAIESLVKANAGLEALALFASVLIAIVIQEKPLSRPRIWQMSASAALVVFFSLLFYQIESGSLRSFPAYIRNSIEITAGYSEAMSLNGPYWQVLVAVLTILALLVGLPLIESSISGLAAGFLPALTYAFFSFKAGMVRQDAHASDVQLNIALAGMFLLLLARRRRSFYFVLSIQLFCLYLSHQFISEAWPTTNRTVASRLMFQGTLPVLRGWLAWPRTWSSLEAAGRSNLAPLILSGRIHKVIDHQPVEAVPWDVALVKANQGIWQPRPVFQGYAAYTPRLDRMNAGYLHTSRAAKFALVTWGDVDGRHPFIDTPLSWREQLDRYHTIGAESEMVLLERGTSHHFDASREIDEETTTWGRENRVPQTTDPVIVSAHIQESFTGRIRSLLFRLNPFFIEVTRQSGKVERYRALRANFGDGVIINQFPETLGDLALLAIPGCSLADPVVSFRLETETPSEFESAIPLQWSRLVRHAETPGNCVAITQTSAEFPVWGGRGTVAVSAGASTEWSAQPAESWLSTPPAAPKTGSATLDYSVLRNSNPKDRQAAIVIGRQSFSIFQRGAGATLGDRASVQLGYYASAPSEVTAASADLAARLNIFVDRFDVFSAGGGQPVLGDWTGNGQMRIGLFRDGHWYLDLNGNGRWDGKEGGDGVFSFGLPGDIAVPGDWAGDGKTRLGVFRHGEWAFDMNGNLAFDRTDKFVQFGLAGDIPVVGKWSHERIDRVGVFRDGTWIVDSNGNGIFDYDDQQFAFGVPGDKPLISIGTGNIGVFRKGDCVLATNDARTYDLKNVISLHCGASPPLIASW